MKPIIFVIMAAGIICCSLPMPSVAQIIFSDETYNESDWWTYEHSDFSASQVAQQLLTGGNPGPFLSMTHILPVPSDPAGLTRMEVGHILASQSYDPYHQGAIEYLDYSEDIKLRTLPWEQAFVTCFAAVYQGFRLFRSKSYIRVIADTTWKTYTFPGLKAEHFQATDGSGLRPDFSKLGSKMYFGFIRLNTRSATQPPYPADQDLVYEHGSDNFTVTLYQTPPANRKPRAGFDEFFYTDMLTGKPIDLPVLENDSDPDGNRIRILSVGEPGFGGEIVTFNDSLIAYKHESFLAMGIDTDQFEYTIIDELDTATAMVVIKFCDCPIECLYRSLSPLLKKISSTKKLVTSLQNDSLDVSLFRQFRDEVLMPREQGAALVNLYYQHAPELINLMLFDEPELGRQAANLALTVQSPIRSLIEGDSSEVITQAIIDSVQAFSQALISVASDSLQNDLNAEFARTGPLNNFVDQPFAEVVHVIAGEQIPTSISPEQVREPKGYLLEQNYPNPFNPETTISFDLKESGKVELKIYNMQGQEIKTFIHSNMSVGNHKITFNTGDLSSGVYIYELRTNNFIASKKMILLK